MVSGEATKPHSDVVRRNEFPIDGVGGGEGSVLGPALSRTSPTHRASVSQHNVRDQIRLKKLLILERQVAVKDRQVDAKMEKIAAETEWRKMELEGRREERRMRTEELSMMNNIFKSMCETMLGAGEVRERAGPRTNPSPLPPPSTTVLTPGEGLLMGPAPPPPGPLHTINRAVNRNAPTSTASVDAGIEALVSLGIQELMSGVVGPVVGVNPRSQIARVDQAGSKVKERPWGRQEEPANQRGKYAKKLDQIPPKRQVLQESESSSESDSQCHSGKPRPKLKRGVGGEDKSEDKTNRVKKSGQKRQNDKNGLDISSSRKRCKLDDPGLSSDSQSYSDIESKKNSTTTTPSDRASESDPENKSSKSNQVKKKAALYESDTTESSSSGSDESDESPSKQSKKSTSVKSNNAPETVKQSPLYFLQGKQKVVGKNKDDMSVFDIGWRTKQLFQDGSKKTPTKGRFLRVDRCAGCLKCPYAIMSCRLQ